MSTFVATLIYPIKRDTRAELPRRPASFALAFFLPRPSYACALGKEIYGYRGDWRRTGENDGAIVNLQVHYWIEKEEEKKKKGKIFTKIDDLIRFFNINI